MCPQFPHPNRLQHHLVLSGMLPNRKPLSAHVHLFLSRLLIPKADVDRTSLEATGVVSASASTSPQEGQEVRWLSHMSVVIPVMMFAVHCWIDGVTDGLRYPVCDHHSV